MASSSNNEPSSPTSPHSTPFQRSTHVRVIKLEEKLKYLLQIMTDIHVSQPELQENKIGKAESIGIYKTSLQITMPIPLSSKNHLKPHGFLRRRASRRTT